MIKYLLLSLLFSSVSAMDQARPYTKPSKVIRAKVRFQTYIHPQIRTPKPVKLVRVKSITIEQLEQSGWVIMKKKK